MHSLDQIEGWREQVDASVAAHTAATKVLQRARATVVETDDEFYAAQEAQQIVQAVAETIQEAAHDRIAGVVSRCLAAVFDEPYEFRINFLHRYGQHELMNDELLSLLGYLLGYHELKNVESLSVHG